MSASRSQPAALEPYLLSPPADSQILLTGTLSSNASWLAAHYVSSALQPDSDEEDADTAVLLVSWLRDTSFWRTEIRRVTVRLTFPCRKEKCVNVQQGLDISRLSQLGKCAFVDCSTNPALTLAEAERDITSAIAGLSGSSSEGRHKKVTLLLDAPDILLATSTTTAAALNNSLLTLRSQDSVHSTIISLSADYPFVSSAVPDFAESRPTPIEAETASFLTTQAHAARLVLSVRGLDTGAATDVSGVLRATRGGDCGEDSGIREGELLYLVQRDGAVKVFERGSG